MRSSTRSGSPAAMSGRATYKSGVSCDKVFVVPNGVDTALYSPVGATYPIASGKSFRFLFVGGTIYRKGIDLLLTAYRQSFTAQDDVCLVIEVGREIVLPRADRPRDDSAVFC